MLNLEKWGEDKHPLMAMIAQQVVINASDASDFFVDIRGDVLKKLPTPPLEQWLPLYSQNSKILEYVKEHLFCDKNRFTSTAMAYAELLQESYSVLNSLDEKTIARIWSSVSAEERARLSVKITRRIDALYQKNLRNLNAEISEEDDEHHYDQFLKGKDKPECLFFFKVWVPCWWFYRESPEQLFQKAIDGDSKAFEKLLRLDNSVIFESHLSELFHKFKVRTDRKGKAEHNALVLAFHKPVKEPSTPQRVKYFLAGMLSFFSDYVNQRLTEPKLRALFDAAAIDLGHGDYDKDLPFGSDTFAKAIQRELKMWHSLTKPDK